MQRQAQHDLTASDARTSASITVGVDGRLYCHDITPALLPILAELCPGDPQIAARLTVVHTTAELKS